MSLDLDEALQTFIIEGRELLQQMEEALLQMEQTPDDAELVNAVFRAAHTIKGSSGLFGLDYIVAFTHVAESVLDRVRNHEVAFSPALGALLLEVGDHLSALIEGVARREEPAAELSARGEALVARLQDFLTPRAAATPAVPAAVTATPAASASSEEAEQVASEHWH